MNTSILYTIKKDGDFIAISTYSRQAGHRGRFLLTADRIGADHIESDCGGFCEIRRVGYDTVLRLTWLSTYGADRVEGIRQTLRVSGADWRDMLAGETLRGIYDPDRVERPRYDFRDATAVIREVSADKHARRALCKALRSARGNRVYTPDSWVGRGGMYFVDRDGMCGGLVLSSYDKRGRDGIVRKALRYEQHT